MPRHIPTQGPRLLRSFLSFPPLCRLGRRPLLPPSPPPPSPVSPPPVVATLPPRSLRRRRRRRCRPSSCLRHRRRRRRRHRRRPRRRRSSLRLCRRLSPRGTVLSHLCTCHLPCSCCCCSRRLSRSRQWPIGRSSQAGGESRATRNCSSSRAAHLPRRRSLRLLGCRWAHPTVPTDLTVDSPAECTATV